MFDPMVNIGGGAYQFMDGCLIGQLGSMWGGHHCIKKLHISKTHFCCDLLIQQWWSKWPNPTWLNPLQIQSNSLSTNARTHKNIISKIVFGYLQLLEKQLFLNRQLSFLHQVKTSNPAEVPRNLLESREINNFFEECFFFFFFEE